MPLALMQLQLATGSSAIIYVMVVVMKSIVRGFPWMREREQTPDLAWTWPYSPWCRRPDLQTRSHVESDVAALGLQVWMSGEE